MASKVTKHLPSEHGANVARSSSLWPGQASKACCALYSDRAAHYFHTPEDRRQGLQGASELGRQGPGRAGDRAHRGLLAGGPGALGAGLPDPAGPAGQGAGAGRDLRDRGGQPLYRRGLPAWSQHPLRGGARVGGLSLRGLPARAVARDPVPARDPPDRQRQHRHLARPPPPDPALADVAALRARPGPRARVSRRRRGAVLGAAPARRLGPDGSPQHLAKAA